MIFLTYFSLVWNVFSMTNGPDPIHRGRAFINGPVAHDFQYSQDVSPHQVLRQMVDAMEHRWVVAAYGQARSIFVTAAIDFDLPGAGKNAKSAAPIRSVHLDLTGQAAPDGRYRYKIEGDFGDLEIARDHRRSLTVSHDYRAFSDQPMMARLPTANLASFRSYALKIWRDFKAPLFDSGIYRVAYGGSANFEGRLIHVIRVFKPPKRTTHQQGPIPIQRMWTFWRDGAYEIWVFQDTLMPAAVFFTGVEDNVFANLRFSYDQEAMPVRIDIENNSPGFEGRGSIVFHFDRDQVLKEMRLDFSSDQGHDVRLDARVGFASIDPEDDLRLIPPFGYQKVNQEHLKLLVSTQLAGSLLNLKKNGINLRNFKF